MPRATATVPARGLKLSVKDLRATKLRKLYADHVHGIIFWLVGDDAAIDPRLGGCRRSIIHGSVALDLETYRSNARAFHCSNTKGRGPDAEIVSNHRRST